MKKLLIWLLPILFSFCGCSQQPCEGLWKSEIGDTIEIHGSTAVKRKENGDACSGTMKFDGSFIDITWNGGNFVRYRFYGDHFKPVRENGKSIDAWEYYRSK